MTNVVKHDTDSIIAEIHKIFGRPPLARTEEANAYDYVLRQVIEAFHPKDIIETVLIRDFVNEIWADVRNDRLVVDVLDGRTQRRREFQLQRLKATPAVQAVAPPVSHSEMKPVGSALDDEAETWAMHQSLDFLRNMSQMKMGSLQRKGLVLELMSRYRTSKATLALSKQAQSIPEMPLPIEHDSRNQSESTS